MGEKDTTEKILEDYNDVFSDIVNVLLFNGESVVKEDSLRNTKDKSQYKFDGKIHEQERDVSKIWEDGNVIISLIGIENQTQIDNTMPLRVIGYDGASYRAQLLANNKKYYPVVTIILYYGEKRWNKNLSLYDVINVPEELKPYVNNYEINVFEMAYLTEEQKRLFKSDFKILVDYLVQKRTTKNYVGSRDEMKHRDETLKLMKVITGNEDFGVAIEKGGNNMCEVIDRIKRDAVVDGYVEAVKAKAMDKEDAAKLLNISVAEFEEIYKKA